MQAERWKKIEDIFQKALKHDEAHRAAVIEDSCAGDESLRREVESLLAHHKDARGFIETPAFESSDADKSEVRDQAPVALQPGMRLGECEIQKLIGSGGMGEVYRARDTRLARDVAIKVLPSYVAGDPDRLRRFEQEAKAAAALNHPNILAVHQLGTYQGAPYLISELLEGSTLREQLMHGPLPTRKAIDYGVQIARGLAAAHEKGIVHRDLKPENLFVTKDGRVKILDFGLAKLVQTRHGTADTTLTVLTETEPGVVLGTVGYMSPEQVRGNNADHRSDIFSFGAILYEMLSGKRAFKKPTSAETMSAILNENPPLVSQTALNLPSALQRVVQRCLEKSPEQRFQSASDLAFALEALSEWGSTSSRAITPLISRMHWKWIAIGAIAILVISGFVMWELPPPLPVVENVTQLTEDGELKSGGWPSTLATDGTRLYFNEGPRIMQVGVSGGHATPLSTTLVGPDVKSIAIDGSFLLTVELPPAFPTGAAGGPLSLLPLPADEPRELAGTVAVDGTFLPDGRILYTQLGRNISVVGKDGSNQNILATGPPEAWVLFAPSLSPDGTRVAFTSAEGENAIKNEIFEMAADGANLRPLLRGGEGGLPQLICCSKWTPDGRYLIFQSRTAGRWDIWALPTHGRFFHGAPAPFRLTNGPVSYTVPTPSRDGKQIFAVGRQRRAELVRYDVNAKEFVPYFGGISVSEFSFSSDGKWVVFVSYPDFTLWRARADGTDRRQLTYPPLQPSCLGISPDDNKILFTSPDGTYVIDMNGGVPGNINGNFGCQGFSLDGRVSILTTRTPGTEYGGKGSWQIQLQDMQSKKISPVPDSVGKLGGVVVTQDLMVSITEDWSKFLLFNLKTKQWSELYKSPEPLDGWWASLDHKYLYFTTKGADPKALRLRLSDRKVETIASLKNLRRLNDDTGTYMSVAPDGSVILPRDISTQEIYSLAVKWP
jgi:eukaryotic-like serine/threonine-protein kinase